MKNLKELQEVRADRQYLKELEHRLVLNKSITYINHSTKTTWKLVNDKWCKVRSRTLT